MFADGFTFVDRELRGEQFVGPEKARTSPSCAESSDRKLFTMQTLFVAIGLHQRVIQREPQQKLLHADAAINQIDIEGAAAQLSPFALFQD